MKDKVIMFGRGAILSNHVLSKGAEIDKDKLRKLEEPVELEEKKIIIDGVVPGKHPKVDSKHLETTS